MCSMRTPTTSPSPSETRTVGIPPLDARRAAARVLVKSPIALRNRAGSTSTVPRTYRAGTSEARNRAMSSEAVSNALHSSLRRQASAPWMLPNVGTKRMFSRTQL